MNEQSVEVRLQDIERHNQDIARRLTELEMRTEGMRVRIDRIVGTTEDLLKRFEAWKSVGNEMGQDVMQLMDQVKTGEAMWVQQQRANLTMSSFMETTSGILKQLAGRQMANDDDEDGRD